MEHTNVIDALVGMGMPLLVALVNQSHWSPKLRALVAVVLCALVGTAVEWVRGPLGIYAEGWRTTVLIVTGSALASYQLWWKPSTIAPTIEAVTTLDQDAPLP